MNEFKYGYQAECDTDDLPDAPVNESGQSKIQTYTRTEGEYKDLECQLEEAREEFSKLVDNMGYFSQRELANQIGKVHKKLKEQG